MKILQVNKFLYRRAGAEAYMLDLAELLAQHGHEVGLWGTKERFKISDLRFQIFEELLMEPINYDKREGLIKNLKKFGHMVWSREAAKKFEEVLKKFKPDIIHIHNIYHHISPSILAVARRYKIPVVMTVHDFKLINGNYSLFDHGAICERDGLAMVWHRCIQDSYLASLADLVEMTVHWALGVYKNDIARYLTPHQFVKNKLAVGGFDEKKIEILPLFVDFHNSPQPPLNLRGGDANDPPLKIRPMARSARLIEGGEGGVMNDYILFAGRLTTEKGIWLLLEIARALPEIKFKIAGAGPEEKSFKLQVSSCKLKNVELLGFVEKSELQQLITGARLVVVPSIWYELSPLAVLEAMAAGKAVMANNLGSMPYLIDDGKTGVLVSVVNMEVGLLLTSWVDKIKQIYHDDALLTRVGQAAKEHVLKENDAEKHYEKIMQIYNEMQ